MNQFFYTIFIVVLKVFVSLQKRKFMTKYLLVILLAIFMMGVPSFAKADCMPEIELIDNVQKPVISIEDNVVRITEACGMTMSVYNLAGGAPIMSVKIDSQDKRFDLNLPKGIYIIKVGKIARKIVIK